MNVMSPEKQKLNLSLDFRWLSLALLAVIVVMFLIWKPWQSPKVSDRTIQVSGQATISARPDEFIFYPNYSFTNSDKQAALAALTAKNNEIVAKLKSLGVPDKGIKTNAGERSSYPFYKSNTDSSLSYTLSITVTVNSESLAQKVQDYLVTTQPSGSVSPQANFSDQKRNALEDQARDAATKDARKKAEQSAKNLGFRLASVKTINDGAGFDGIYATDSKAALTAPEQGSNLTIQPGENDLTYSVTVTYYIR
jgi:uncharacterized protein YggE